MEVRSAGGLSLRTVYFNSIFLLFFSTSRLLGFLMTSQGSTRSRKFRAGSTLPPCTLVPSTMESALRTRVRGGRPVPSVEDEAEGASPGGDSQLTAGYTDIASVEVLDSEPVRDALLFPNSIPLLLTPRLSPEPCQLLPLNSSTLCEPCSTFMPLQNSQKPTYLSFSS